MQSGAGCQDADHPEEQILLNVASGPQLLTFLKQIHTNRQK